ncbi:sigma-70 family RNA polymerase sigma factor [Skermanella stibiiresistens]|uniref:sigma-70 family RNA polymerase sigma factor n=1 Tax=Skermanella stibiiresistens TaxID=913326 RepID=UPI0004B74D87|nr:sigma-70 family RNA polymerase sigma factor [Skermanella stibiiresistens]
MVAKPTEAAEDGQADLIRRCADGDSRALRALYDHHGGLLLALALRMLGDRRLAEEVVQDTFVQVWRNAGRFDRAFGSARGWIIGILRHRALDMRDRERRSGGPPGTMEIGEAELAGAIEGIEPPAFEDRGALRGCLGELKEGPRRSITLAYMDGCSHQEIARHLDQPLGTVKSWILRGLSALRECLER